MEGLQQGLRARGYAEGRNLVWELRSTDGSLDRLPQLAEELVRLKVDLILARASSGAMAARVGTLVYPASECARIALKMVST
jgi:putative ABC transport system substrate-binding protein